MLNKYTEIIYLIKKNKTILIKQKSIKNACNRTRTCGVHMETDYESVAFDRSAIHALSVFLL